MIGISACLVVRNEEKLIGRALESLKGVVDEIVVVHSGECTDRTIEISKKYTKKVFFAPDRGAGCYNRPLAFSKATGDWIIYIDADEYLSEEIRKNLRKLSEDKSVDAYGFLHEVMFRYTPLKKVGYRLCFFRKTKGHARGFMHETVKVDGVVKNVNLLLHHRPLYDNYTWKVFIKKCFALIRTQSVDMVNEGRAGLFGPLYLFVAPAAMVFVFLRDLSWHKLDNGYPGVIISFYQGLYNFFLYWRIFMIKTFGTK